MECYLSIILKYTLLIVQAFDLQLNIYADLFVVFLHKKSLHHIMQALHNCTG
jgi:hypothetical protein